MILLYLEQSSLATLATADTTVVADSDQMLHLDLPTKDLMRKGCKSFDSIALVDCMCNIGATISLCGADVHLT